MATLSSEAIRTFHEWNLGKVKAGYLKLRLKEGQIQITELGEEGLSWEKTTQLLSETDPCWLIYHFDYAGENVTKSKTLLIQWIPSKATIRDKMQYAMWSRGIKSSLSGVNKTVHGSNMEDLSSENILEQISRH